MNRTENFEYTRKILNIHVHKRIFLVEKCNQIKINISDKNVMKYFSRCRMRLKLVSLKLNIKGLLNDLIKLSVLM